MKPILSYLHNRNTLDYQTAKDTLSEITTGKYNLSQMIAFISVYNMRPINPDELRGFRDAMMELCLPIHLPFDTYLDVCGTGGDGKNTFNISTTSAFVLAGLGVNIAKHGNYGVSSSYGSSNLLEDLGYTFNTQEERIIKEMEACKVSFLHAPLFHPAMKNIAGIRKDLALKTFFNMLGPLVNPSNPPYQLIGVYSLELARIYHYILQNSSIEYTIVHALDGYDEVSLTSSTKVYTPHYEDLIEPFDFGCPNVEAHEIYGGDSVTDAKKIFLSVLQNTASKAQKEVVIANAALGLKTVNPSLSYMECAEQCNESIESGRAFLSFKKLIEVNQEQ